MGRRCCAHRRWRPAALSRDLRTYAETVGGREQMAIRAFASALEIIPRTLAENAGLDPVTTLTERILHALRTNRIQCLRGWC